MSNGSRRSKRLVTAETAPHRALAPDAPVPEPPAIIVHSLPHALAALRTAAETRRAIILATAPNAARYAGPGWFGALVATARAAVSTAEFTAAIDCGEDAGAALGALRAGIEMTLFTGHKDVAVRLSEIAARHGLALRTSRLSVALDLGSEFFADESRLRQRCAEFLASAAGIC